MLLWDKVVVVFLSSRPNQRWHKAKLTQGGREQRPWTEPTKGRGSRDAEAVASSLPTSGPLGRELGPAGAVRFPCQPRPPLQQEAGPTWVLPAGPSLDPLTWGGPGSRGASSFLNFHCPLPTPSRGDLASRAEGLPLEVLPSHCHTWFYWRSVRCPQQPSRQGQNPPTSQHISS